jgi:tellurite resistance protein
MSAVAPDHDLPYWPSYGDIAPSHRWAYITWLADGRQDASAPIGYVFLFMYGLERRVLVDMAENASLMSELPHIRSEMRRLLRIYGPQSGSFQSYASAFLEVIDFRLAERDREDDLGSAPPPLAESTWSVPLSLRIGLGQLAASGTPVPAEWALAWGWFHPDIDLRTPATRCTDEFACLFAIRYAEKFGEGLVIRPGKSRIRHTYRPASTGLPSIEIESDGTRDVFEQKAAGRKLAALVDSVTDELDAYSRWMGRNPGSSRSLAASAFFPVALLAEPGGDVSKLRDWATQQVQRADPVRMPGQTLCHLWSPDQSDKLSKGDSVLLAQLLEHLGIGIEPDVRFGGVPLTSADKAVLFSIKAEAPHTATSAYGAAITLVHLAAAVGAADGQISRAEVKQLGDHVASSLRLTPAETTRLYAHLTWLSGVDIKLTGLKKRLHTLTKPQRRHIGDVLVTVAAADGVISPEEVTTLRKIFKLLDLDPETLTSRLSASQTTSGPAPAERPIVVREAGVQDPGFPIPPRQVEGRQPQAVPSVAFRLDDATLQQIESETAAVSLLLVDIFGEDQEQSMHQRPDVSAAAATSSVGNAMDVGTDRSVQGLDLPHTRFLRALAERDQWEAAAFEALATKHHVLPDGAIDTINELALDAVEEPAIEGEETLTINAYAMQELLK